MTHREQVDRASLVDCDGILWNGREPWPDGALLRDMFWTYYAPLIEDAWHGRALRALMHATPHGMKAFSKSSEFRACMVETMTPFLKKRKPGDRRRPANECAWCTRPGVEVGGQCLGCGAWRREP
jgi:hypothetical protein